MIKHIVFDFGGVILDLDGVHTGYPDDLAEIFDVPIETAKKIWEENKTLVMTGQESPRQFLERIKTARSLDFKVEEGIALWEMRNCITKDRIDWELVQFLGQLRNNYKVHMLTDQIQLDNGARKWKHEFERHFHTIFRSYEQGFRKPFKEAYENLLNTLDTSADEVVFIDDSQANITTATEMGIHGILYTFKQHELLVKEFDTLEIRHAALSTNSQTQ